MLKPTHVSNAVDVLSILRVICSTGAETAQISAPDALLPAPHCACAYETRGRSLPVT